MGWGWGVGLGGVGVDGGWIGVCINSLLNTFIQFILANEIEYSGKSKR